MDHIRTIGFARLLKYNAQTGEFEGVMASEHPDDAREIFDYEQSKPYFVKWSNAIRTATGGQSVGNVREMHQQIAAGKLTAITFDDARKKIYTRGVLVDQNIREKAAAGLYSGLSIGGHYLDTFPDPTDPRLLRYVCRPVEVSIVDLPCNPEATFELTGRDGARKIMKFSVPTLPAYDEDADPAQLEKAAPTKRVGDKDLPRAAFAYAPGDTVADWKYPIHDASHVRNALARWGQEKGIPADQKAKVYARIKAAAKKFGIEVSDQAEKVIKSLYDVGGLCNTLSNLDSIRSCLANEAEYEEDESDVPGRLLDVEVMLAALVRDVAVEETAELLAAAGITADTDADGGVTTTEDGLMPGENPGGAADLTKITAIVEKAVQKSLKKMVKKAIKKALKKRDVPSRTDVAAGIDHASKLTLEAVGAALRDGPIEDPAQKAAAGDKRPYLFVEPKDINKVGAAAGDPVALKKAADAEEATVQALRKVIAESTDEVAVAKAQGELDAIARGSVRKALSAPRLATNPDLVGVRSARAATA